MTKQEFLGKIQNGIKRLPKGDIDRHLQYYSEMIDDRIEDGMNEADAVSAAGDVDDIINDILQEKAYKKQKEKELCDKNKDNSRSKAMVCVLKSIMWFAFALMSIVLFSVIIGMYAAALIMSISGIYGIVTTIVMLFKAVASVQSLAIVGISLICLGVSAPWFIITHRLTKLTFKLSKNTVKLIKTFKKEEKEEQL